MALVLTRRIGETLVIGDDIHLTILDVRGSQVKVAVDAPKDVSIHRHEIYEKIQRQKENVA